jgi:4-deoxy-L-threo-5-hexosulose-uronate ketol-isomerase
MEVRYSTHPEEFVQYPTTKIREHFLIENLMNEGRVKFIYSHYERLVVGGAVPTMHDIDLHTYEPLKSGYFLERREMGVVNIGEKGKVMVDGVPYELNNKEGLYIGRGSESVTFISHNSQRPARFFICSSPAHKRFPCKKFSINEAEAIESGSTETADRKKNYLFLPGKGAESCQLIMGMSILKPGSVWSTMPLHLHERRTEICFYFDLPENQKIMHLMGQAHETRHLIAGNEQAVISPPWSIQSGAGTHHYNVIWAMAGENQDYLDNDETDIHYLK